MGGVHNGGFSLWWTFHDKQWERLWQIKKVITGQICTCSHSSLKKSRRSILVTTSRSTVISSSKSTYNGFRCLNAMTNSVYSNRKFTMRVPLPNKWAQNYKWEIIWNTQHENCSPYYFLWSGLFDVSDSQMLLIADHFGSLKNQIIPSGGNITKHIMFMYRKIIHTRVRNYLY